MVLQRFAGILDTIMKAKGFGAIILVSLFLSLAGVLVACGANNTESSPPVQSSNNSESNTNNTTGTEPPANNQQGVAPSDDEARDFLDSQEGQAFQAVVQEFTEAYLRGNSAAMKEQLIDPENQMHQFPSEDQSDNVESMTLKVGSNKIQETSIVASNEISFKGSDTYQYLTLEMEKVNQEWKVRFFALEQ